jgi:glycosyltransferase involved in cell wall biosynthesis
MSQISRIACYGYVDKNSGSGTGANFLILEELLRRGFEIDFYGWEDFNKPKELLGEKNFRFFSLPEKTLVGVLEQRLPKGVQTRLSSTLYPVLNTLVDRPNNNRILRKEIVEQHANKQYDLLLFLGLYSLFKLSEIPTVSWIQGPPQTEWLYIKKLRKTIISLCGLSTYLKAKGFYSFRDKNLLSEINYSDMIICLSQWSKDRSIAYGVDPKKIEVLPFPIDLELFNISADTRNKTVDRKKTFLWLGRIDPRKRLDLLMEAYALLLKERQDVHLKIVGGFRGEFKGYKKLIDSFEFPDRVEYEPSVSRSDVPNLMKQCDILIQPSEGENFGSSVAEALCCGIPAIVGPTNGTKDFISSSSFVFEQYTSESLKNTMMKALRSVEQCPEEIAQDARKTSEKNFSIIKVVDNLENIFEQAFENHRV